MLCSSRSSGKDLEAAAIGHDDVEQDHVRLQRPRLEDGVARVACLADRLEIVLRVHEQPEARPDDAVVIDDEDSNAHVTGNCTTSVVVTPGCDSIRRLPPRSATRSRIP